MNITQRARKVAEAIESAMPARLMKRRKAVAP